MQKSISSFSWTSHACRHYGDPHELMQALAPFFKEGLENNEYCLWVTCDPITPQEVQKALLPQIPDIARRFATGQIEILPCTQWYRTPQGNVLPLEMILMEWFRKEEMAKMRGFSGLRLTGNTYRREKKQDSTAHLVADLENAKRELQRINEELEHKVLERTELAEKRAKKLHDLASALTLTEQKERARLAEILHDHLQQMLVAAKISITSMRRHVLTEKSKLSVVHAEKMVDEAIAASRTLTMELSPPVLRDASFGTAMEWLARWFKEKHQLSVNVSFEADLPAPEEDIRIFLFQSVRELLFNVVKHAGTKEANIRLSSSDTEFCIFVEDQGKGFDLSNVMKHSPEGFGLFNVRERLEMLRGSMLMESEPGKGTRVRLCAPAEKPALKERVVEKHKKIWTETSIKKNLVTRILIVDDHKILRQGMMTLLGTHKDFEVVGEAADGEEAILKAESLMPDVIIMDISMPKMNGIEATRRIKARYPSVQIIGLSLHDSEDMARTMRDAGASAYFNKTRPIDTLIETIRLHNPSLILAP